MANAINLAFPGAGFSYPTPPVGVRAEAFTRATTSTGAFYEWAVPAGVTYIKAIGIGGASDGVTNGSSSTIAGFVTFGNATVSSNGTFTPTTTRNTQYLGANYQILGSAYFSGYGQGTFNGGCGVMHLQNLVPGMLLRITIGTGTPQNGVIVLEY